MAEADRSAAETVLSRKQQREQAVDQVRGLFTPEEAALAAQRAVLENPAWRHLSVANREGLGVSSELLDALLDEIADLGCLDCHLSRFLSVLHDAGQAFEPAPQ